MKVTKLHLKYWRERQPNPSWAKTIKITKWSKPHEVSIHSLINQNTDIKNIDKNYAASNLISLIKRYTNNPKELRQRLFELHMNPGTIMSPEKRAAYAKKWLTRLNRK